MDLTGEYRIPASTERAWAALNDPEVLKTCIPGCRELLRVSDTEFVATVGAKVGPVSATFKGNVMLSDLDPPRAYTISGQGQGGAAGFAKGSARVTLTPDGAETILHYEAKADIGGKLASVGSRLIQGVAKKNADDFFGAFAQRLKGESAPSPAPVPSVEEPATPLPPEMASPRRWIWAVIAGTIVAAVLYILFGR